MISRILRGGSYADDSRFLRSTFRLWFQPVLRSWNFGFRIVIRRAE